MNKRIVRRLAALAATTGCVALLATQTPAGTWTRIGQGVALAAVSLRQADATAQRLSARLERTPAAAGAVVAETTTGASSASTDAAQTVGTTAEAVPPPVMESVEPPAEDGSGGRVVEQRVGGGTTEAGLRVKNKSGVSPDLAEALASSLPYQIEFGSPEPQVLIYHTHATETYMPYDAGYFNDGDTRREADNPHNVRAVGDALAAALTAAGVTVLHDTTLHDSPSYRGAYDRSAATMEQALREHPSIKVTLDIHRDGLMVNSTDKLKPTVTINGQKAAQLMVVCGVLTTDALPHPNWRQNLCFAARLQKTLDDSYEGLARPLSLVSARYNQYLSPGSLLIEMGSEGNTTAEAAYTAQLLAETLVRLWKE